MPQSPHTMVSLVEFTHPPKTMKRGVSPSRFMVERRLSVLLVSLFLLPLVPLGDEMTDVDAPDVVQWTSDEAASHWSIGGSPALEKSSLRATTGLLHPVTGTFDPLLSTPMLPEGCMTI